VLLTLGLKLCGQFLFCYNLCQADISNKFSRKNILFIRCIQGFIVEMLRKENTFEDLRKDGRIILNMDL